MGSRLSYLDEAHKRIIRIPVKSKYNCWRGEEKYKKWVLDYVDSWLERIKQNNGILPDNIGLNGQIGEYRNGQWWGGLYGWYERYGVMMMFASLSVASECTYLLSGDKKYLELLRSQIDQLMKRSASTPEGQGPLSKECRWLAQL